MNLFIFLFVLIITLAAGSIESVEPKFASSKNDSSSDVKEEVDKIIEFFKTEKELLKKVLKEFGSKVHDKLFVLFPEMRKQFEEIENEMKLVKLCYDEEIDHQSNNSVHIFKDKVYTVVLRYFESHGRILEGLNFEKIKERVKIFLKSLSHLAELVIKCVKDRKQGQKKLSKFGLTMFSAYSHDEIEAKFMNHMLSEEYNKTNAVKLGQTANPNSIFCNKNKTALDPEKLPKSFSWHDKGFVSPVKAQGCSDCYIFATTSGIESQYSIRANVTPPVQFSIQRQLDCLVTGCKGGNPGQVNDYFRENGAVLYGYSRYNASSNTSFCRNYPKALKVDVTCKHDMLSEEEILRLLVRSGPMTVIINAPKDMYYIKGPYHGDCQQRNLNHALLLVGYNSEYYIIKNSWGTGWGIKGYLYLPRGGNKCGVGYHIFAAYVKPF